MSWLEEVIKFVEDFSKVNEVGNNKSIPPIVIKFIDDYYEINNDISMSFNEIIFLFKNFNNMIKDREMCIKLANYSNLKLYPATLNIVNIDGKRSLINKDISNPYYIFFKCIYDSLNEHSLENENIICFDGNKIIMKTNDNRYHYLSFTRRKDLFPHEFYITCNTIYSKFYKSDFTYRDCKIIKDVINFTIKLENSQSVCGNVTKKIFNKKYLRIFK